MNRGLSQKNRIKPYQLPRFLVGQRGGGVWIGFRRSSSEIERGDESHEAGLHDAGPLAPGAAPLDLLVRRARVSLARAKQKGKMREAMRVVFGSVLMVAKAT